MTFWCIRNMKKVFCLKSRIWCIGIKWKSRLTTGIIQSYFNALYLLTPVVCADEFGFSPQPLCSLPAAGYSWGGLDVCRPSLHIFKPTWSFWGFAEKLFLFRNWNLLAWNQLDFIPELYFSPLNYCWYGFLKAANDKSFLWLWSFLSRQSWRRPKWAHSVSS